MNTPSDREIASLKRLAALLEENPRRVLPGHSGLLQGPTGKGKARRPFHRTRALSPHTRPARDWIQYTQFRARKQGGRLCTTML